MDWSSEVIPGIGVRLTSPNALEESPALNCRAI